MWIEELPNGKYKYVERYTDEITGRIRKVSITHTKKTKKVQEEMFLKLKERIEEKTKNPASSDITLYALIDEWLELMAKQLKPSTLNDRMARCNVIKRFFGDRIVKNIPPKLYNQFFLYLQNERHQAYGTVKHYEMLLKQLLKHANFYYGLDVKTKFIVQKINVSQKDDFKYLEKDELQSVVQQLLDLGDEETARYVQLQTLTGTRTGELCAINFEEDINWKEKTVTISKTYNGRDKIFQTPKSGKTRTIHINDLTVRLLKEQIRCTRLKIMAKGLPKTQTYLFLSRQGVICSVSTWSRRLNRVHIEGKKITTHIFRHTFISRMVEQGVDTKLIAEHVGHANTQMVENVYSHFTDLMNKRLEETINHLEII